jgi:protein SCO1
MITDAVKRSYLQQVCLRMEITMKKTIKSSLRKISQSRWFLALAVATFILTFGSSYLSGNIVFAQDSQAQKAAPETAGESAAHKYFTDVQLVNQDGEKMRFYTDLLQGKVVIINSFFATCQGACLPLNRNLQKVQQALGDRIGKDVKIISISVDPTVDTPASLKEYAKKLNAKPGWYFLTGEKENVDFALKKIGQFVDDKQDHLNIFIIGNERTGLWKKAFGLANSDELVKVVESVINDKPVTTAQ